jgi:class 3 adenylate cyclase
MPRRGYRFTGPVVTEVQDGAIAAPPQVDVARGTAPTRSDDAGRRQIIAMSCELVGVAAGADGVGLEELRAAVADFQRCVSETADRHNGFVVIRLGNPELVLFGYPAAHEHDAERAVRAGLESCAAIGTLRPGAEVPVRCRVGIATGMAMIGDLRRGGALRNREIVGDAPNLAMRLQLSARPDIVAIEPTTRQLIDNLFECRELDAIDTSGGTEPMRIWQVLGASILANRFEALHRRGWWRKSARRSDASFPTRCCVPSPALPRTSYKRLSAGSSPPS